MKRERLRVVGECPDFFHISPSVGRRHAGNVGKYRLLPSLFRCCAQRCGADAGASGFLDPLFGEGFRMSIARMLLLLVLGQPALAQQAPQVTGLLADGPDLAVVQAPHGMRFALGVSSQSNLQLESRQSIFTSVYWSRAYEQRAQLEARFGVHLAHGPTATSRPSVARSGCSSPPRRWMPCRCWAGARTRSCCGKSGSRREKSSGNSSRASIARRIHRPTPWQ